MTYETKKEVNKRLCTMHNIKMTPSLLFSHAKDIFPFLPFALTSVVNNLLNNINISTWSLIRQHIFIRQWHDMLK